MNTRRLRRTDSRESCPRCGGLAASEITYSDTQEFRGLTLDIEGLKISKCSNCGEKWFTSAQEQHNESALRQAYASKRDAVREELGLLHAEDIARIRDKLQLTQKDAGRILGGGPKAFNKYESGEVLQSQAMDKLLRLVDFFGEPALRVLTSERDAEAAAIQAAPHNEYHVFINSQAFTVLLVSPSARDVANSPDLLKSAMSGNHNDVDRIARWTSIPSSPYEAPTITTH